MRTATLALSGVFVVCLLVAIIGRVRYPFELEWMEGAAVDHVRNILAGGVLYPCPNLTFVPYSYHPLFFLTSAAVATLTGLGFLPLRLVSIASSLASLALVYAMAARETGRRDAGIVAAGLLAASFPLSGWWMDIGRVDSLFVALLLGCLYLVRFGSDVRSAAVAGLLVGLSFFTKQTALLVAAPLAVYLFLVSRRRAAVFVATFGACVATGVALLYWQNGAWYVFYAFQLPGQHELDWRLIYAFWTADILGHLPYAAAIVGIYLFAEKPSGAARFYACAAAGMLIGAWSTRVHSGGWLNCLMPAHAFYALATPVAVATVAAWLERGSIRLLGLRRRGLEVLLLAQLVVLLYNPLAAVPSKQDEAAGRQLVALMASIPGEVYLFHHGYLGSMAGKERYAHQLAYYDILRGTDAAAIAQMTRVMSDAIRSRRFAAIIVDNVDHEPTPFASDLETYYTRAHRVFDDPTVFWPVAGIRLRPEYVYVPRH